jgi:hypothetical protein|tara:strand:+ start:1607 stop:2146 length:540 start_codon:yes stop_codon:yes gene_type:complete
MKMKNKIPPDNTGKKYLTELTPKQRKYIDVYCSKYGEISATACAIAAGYSRDSAHTKASELLDYRKYPQVRTEIDLRLAHSRELWSITRDKSMAHLFKIGEEARKKGNLGVAAKCEELRGKLGGLYIEKLHTMHEHRELSEEELNEKIRKIFPTRTEFKKGSKSMLEGIYEEDKEPDKD